MIGPRRTPRAARTISTGPSISIPTTFLIMLLTLGLAAGLTLVGPAAAHADETQTYVKVTIGSLAPAVPKAGDTVVITGTVTNTSKITLSKLQALMWRNQAPITDAEQMSQAVSSDPSDPLGSRIDTLGTWQQLTRSNDPGTIDLPAGLAPGKSMPFTVRATTTQFEFPGTPGIYLVGVQLRGTTDGLGGTDLTLGRARTFLPVGVAQEAVARPVPVCSIVVLSAAPTQLTASTGTGGTTTPARFADDTLVSRLADDGDLGRLLALARQPGYSVLVDPSLVVEARDLAKPYTVRESDQKPVDRPASAAAQSWLNRLAAVPKDRLFQLPYANPDVAALAHSGHPDLYRPDLGADILPGVPRIALPAGGQADEETLRLAGTGTLAAVLLARDATGTTAPLVTAPEVPVPIVTFDQAALDGGPGPDPRTTPAQIRQRYLADTLVAASGTNPTAVVRLITNASQARAVPAVPAPWLAAVSLTTLLDQSPQAWPTAPTYPTSARRAELSPRTVGAAAELARDSIRYAALQADPGTTTAATAQIAVARATSVHWRNDPAGARAYVQPQQEALDQVLDGGVRIDRLTKILLTNESGETGFSIINDTDVDVRVGVKFLSAQPQRLTVKSLDALVIPAGTRAAVNAEFSAQANGDVPVTAQLVTADGQPIGRTVSFVVSATQYGMVGVLIAVAAAVVLFASTFLRIRQVRRETAAKNARDEASDAGADDGLVDGMIDTRGPRPAPPDVDVPPESAQREGDHTGADTPG